MVVVEHDEGMIHAADHLIDVGPGPGQHGGTVVAEGTLDDVTAASASLTGAYLSRQRVIAVPQQRRPVNTTTAIVVKGASQNNLKSIDVAFPVGGLVCVTGVSGSGKSTLVNEILFKAARKAVHGSRVTPGAHSRVNGLRNFDRIVQVDQSPIGRTPRSNPATYTGIFDDIRRLFAQARESRIRGYAPGRFSFNVKGAVKEQEEERLRRRNAASVRQEMDAPEVLNVRIGSRTGFALPAPAALARLELTFAGDKRRSLSVVDESPHWQLLPAWSFPPSAHRESSTSNGRRCRLFR